MKESNDPSAMSADFKFRGRKLEKVSGPKDCKIWFYAICQQECSKDLFNIFEVTMLPDY